VPTASEAHRIETHPEEQRVQVRINGETVASSRPAGTSPGRTSPRSSNRASTGPPVPSRERPPTSVGGEDAVAWSYEDPIEQVSEIRDLVSFYNERVDLQLD
jgi:uncharacterized protein (DUF427 family)